VAGPAGKPLSDHATDVMDMANAEMVLDHWRDAEVAVYQTPVRNGPGAGVVV
jgi:hypothetical protein